MIDYDDCAPPGGHCTGFFTPIDVYLVNPRNVVPTTANFHAMATFDLCLLDPCPEPQAQVQGCKLKHGQVTLYRWAHGIIVELVNYMPISQHSGSGRSEQDIPSWMGSNSEEWDRLLFTAIDQLCKRQGLSFAGMLESRRFLLS